MRSGNFVIGVIGSANLYQELIKAVFHAHHRKAAHRGPQVARSADVERCHILFVGRTDLSLLPEIYNRMIWQAPTLVVTEYAGALEDGAVVNFVRVDNLLKYEMSLPMPQTWGGRGSDLEEPRPPRGGMNMLRLLP
jgi:hypothetical protein